MPRPLRTHPAATTTWSAGSGRVPIRWAAVDHPRLKGDARSAYADPDNDPVLSTAPIWEIGVRHGLGELPLPVALRDFFAREIETRGYRVLDVRRDHAERAAELPYLDAGHRDPLYRIRIAQALVEGVALVSVDRRFDAYRALGLELIS